MAEDGYTTEEGWHTADDGVKLYTKTWKPKNTVKAHLIWIHGFSDHCNNQGQLFPNLASSGIEVAAWDQRGWGQSIKSPKERGAAGPTPRVMADITGFIKQYLPSQVPLFVMGHSMGGGQVLTYAAIGPKDIRSQIRGYLVESPLIQVAPRTQPWKITELAGRMAVKVMPKFQMKAEVKSELLSHDQAVNDEYRDDPLCHQTGTLEQLQGMLDRGDNLYRGKIVPKEDAKAPGEQGMIFMFGGADDVVDPRATRKFIENFTWTDKKSTEYPDWYHVPHREAGEDGPRMIREVAQWILERS